MTDRNFDLVISYKWKNALSINYPIFISNVDDKKQFLLKCPTNYKK